MSAYFLDWQSIMFTVRMIIYDHDDDGADEDDHASNQMHHDDNHDS